MSPKNICSLITAIIISIRRIRVRWGLHQRRRPSKWCSFSFFQAVFSLFCHRYVDSCAWLLMRAMKERWDDWLWLCVGMERDDCLFATETGVNSWTSWNPLRVTRSHCVIVFCCCCCSLSLRPLPSLLLFCFWLDDVFQLFAFCDFFANTALRTGKQRFFFFRKTTAAEGGRGAKAVSYRCEQHTSRKKVGKREKLFSLQQS